MKKNLMFQKICDGLLMDNTKFLQEQLDLIKSKQIDNSITWQDITDFRVRHTGESENICTTRKGAKIILEYLNNGWHVTPPVSQTFSSELADLKKERYKIQTEKLELNRWLRESARDEMIVDEIIRVLKQLKPFKTPECLYNRKEQDDALNENHYLLCFGDAHYGIEFEVKDLLGNVLNAYSPAIFEERMWNLFEKLVLIIEKEQITELNIFELGDGIQGIIRLNSQLMKLKYGVIESSIKYAYFIAGWLNELSQYVRINFQMVVDSNHNQLRICNAPKNAFPEENMSTVMLTLIKEILQNNPNVCIIENPTGMNYQRIVGFNVLGIHGEVKNVAEEINKISRSYQCNIDYLISAHIHHLKSEEIGQRSECMSIRSIVGVDPYGMSLNKTSDAGASLFVFNHTDGCVCEHKFKLY